MFGPFDSIWWATFRIVTKLGFLGTNCVQTFATWYSDGSGCVGCGSSCEEIVSQWS